MKWITLWVAIRNESFLMPHTDKEVSHRGKDPPDDDSDDDYHSDGSARRSQCCFFNWLVHIR